jgi:hypothetical protein
VHDRQVETRRRPNAGAGGGINWSASADGRAEADAFVEVKMLAADGPGEAAAFVESNMLTSDWRERDTFGEEVMLKPDPREGDTFAEEIMLAADWPAETDAFAESSMLVSDPLEGDMFAKNTLAYDSPFLGKLLLKASCTREAALFWLCDRVMRMFCSFEN